MGTWVWGGFPPLPGWMRGLPCASTVGTGWFMLKSCFLPENLELGYVLGRVPTTPAPSENLRRWVSNELSRKTALDMCFTSHYCGNEVHLTCLPWDKTLGSLHLVSFGFCPVYLFSLLLSLKCSLAMSMTISWVPWVLLGGHLMDLRYISVQLQSSHREGP